MPLRVVQWATGAVGRHALAAVAEHPDLDLAGCLPLLLVADALGATVDDFVYDRRVALADRAFDVAAGRVEPGTVAVVPVCAAEPGIRTFLDLPTVVGRHVLRRPRTA